MGYLGNSNVVQNFTPAVDYFNGNGSATAFTLSRTVGSVFDVQAFIENVPQNPSSAFTVAGNVITFTSAPPSGTNNIYVRYTSPVTQLVKPAPGTVGTTEIASSVTLTTPSISGNLTFTGTGVRITGDFSNATVANRVLFQSSTTNGSTTVGLIPNGTGTQCAWNAYNGTDTANAGVGAFIINTNELRIQSNAVGTGSYVPLTMYTGGSERLRIDTSGNVGIGTTSPAATLDVGSSVARSGAAQNNIYADYRITAATTGVVSSFASRIVGIGGSTYTIPDAAVYKADPIVAQTGVTITNSYGLYIGNMSDPISGGSVTNPWGIYQATSSNKNYFAGDVGIGTNNPQYPLTLVNSTANKEILFVKGSNTNTGTGLAGEGPVAIQNTNNTVGNMAAISNFDSGGNINGQINFINTDQAAGGAIGFTTRTNGGASYGERMRVTQNGGTRFQCENYNAQPSSTNGGVEINNTNASSTFFGFGTGTETHINFGNRNGIRGSIQTTSGGTSYNTTSDYRLKENIVPMTGALAKVSQLNPVTYNWKIGGNGQGFIAHELQEVVPEAVTGEKDAVDENDEPKYQMVDTSFLVATLTAAIQEQQAIIENLKARIEILEDK